MILADNNDIKVKGNRYFKYSRSQARFFPVKKDEALKMIKEGKAKYFNPLYVA